MLTQDFCEEKVKTAPKLPQEEILKIGEDSVLLEHIDNKALVNFRAHSSVAEQVTHNHLVGGPNPSGPRIY